MVDFAIRGMDLAFAMQDGYDAVAPLLDRFHMPDLQERLDQYDWYHSIDVAPGVTTKGMFDNRHALSIGMTTIKDEACFGVYADCEALPDADLLADCIDSSVEQLLAIAEQRSVDDTGAPATGTT